MFATKEKERERERDRETERERARYTERQRDNETERQRDSSARTGAQRTSRDNNFEPTEPITLLSAACRTLTANP